ncbi:MAG: 2-oxoacid:acceptor oxidoreductase family protein [Syntrophorhabdaceae bacterium]|nr:2-oxoacid:acceptor oxidoreductase family protein [Syntrophorhabdaceae bacterium]
MRRKKGHQDLQIVCAGIGGRGVLLASTILIETAISRGFHCLTSDEYGMSQRGGSVISMVKVGDFNSPLIGREEADVLLSFEESEFYRNIHFLKRGGLAIVNTEKTSLQKEIEGILSTRQLKIFLVDCDRLAFACGTIKASNMVLLGFFSRQSVGPFTYEKMRETVTADSKGRSNEVNIKALDAGYKEHGLLLNTPSP